MLVLISNCPQMNNPCNGFDPTAVEVTITGRVPDAGEATTTGAGT